MSTPPPFEERLLKWMERNGLYVGIMAVGVIFSLVVLGGLGLLFFYNQAMKSTPIFQESLAQVKTNDVVRKSLGAHLKEGWLISGSIQYQGTNGSADFQFPIAGEKGLGRVKTKAVMKDGSWEIQSLQLIKDGQETNLLPGK